MSLRLRVVALIGMVLLLSTALGTSVAGYQAKQTLSAELNAGLIGAEQTVISAFEDLPNSDHKGRDLQQLVATFNGNRHVRATLLDEDGRKVQASETNAARAKAPQWFHALLGVSPQSIQIRTPRSIPGYFAILLEPTAELDVGEAWIEFSRVAAVLAGSTLVGLILVYVVIGAAFKPLQSLSSEFGRIVLGDYSGRVAEKGPLELSSLQRGFNAMAAELELATDRNRLLTDQILTVQDEERADIARDLHDEIGPHLFGVNMDAEMILKLYEARRLEEIPDQVRAIQAAVGFMQREVRDLLGRLRPARVTEFGLSSAVRDLATFWAARRTDITVALNLLDAEEQLSAPIKEAAYRVVQEAVNNAIRHANPTRIEVCVEIQNDSDLVVMVFDDGVHLDHRQGAGGLGLVGMRERVIALGGSLTFGRTLGAVGWSVVARIPIIFAAERNLLVEAQD